MSRRISNYWSSDQGHPSEEVLFLAMEGELDLRESQRVRDHVDVCWQCRAQWEKWHEAATAFVDFRARSQQSGASQPPHGWSGFHVQLQQLAAELQHMRRTSGIRMSFLYTVWRATLKILRPLSVNVSRPAWISGAVSIAVVLAVLRFSIVQPPSIQAAEFLRRAASAIPAKQRSFAVLYQRIRIQRGSTTIDREIASNTLDRRAPDHKTETAAHAAPDAATQTAMSVVKMDWRSPLSAQGFADWREGLSQKEDRIFESQTSMTLRTTPLGDKTDGVRYASLTVDRTDWRPIAEHVEFLGQPTLDVSEISFELREPVPTVMEVAPAATTVTESLRVEAERVVPLVEAAETELAVRYALHGTGADLGEPIEIQTNAKGSTAIAVVGIVPTTERKQVLLEVLRGIPHVAVQIRTEQESVAKNLPPPTTRAETLIATARSPIERDLLAHFGDPLQVDRFSTDAIAATRALMARAWALQHLSERYGAAGSQKEQVLNSSSRQLLWTMRRDHYHAMSEAASQLNMLLSPVLRPLVPENPEPPAKVPLFTRAQEVQRLVLVLLSGSDAANGNEPVKAIQDLLGDLRGLQMTLEEQP